ncbi:MAG: hypothetical protein GH147_09470 [Clostridia bacterium]|nr:hypothetical protein [Clostridia bacterium]
MFMENPNLTHNVVIEKCKLVYNFLRNKTSLKILVMDLKTLFSVTEMLFTRESNTSGGKSPQPNEAGKNSLRLVETDNYFYFGEISFDVSL